MYNRNMTRVKEKKTKSTMQTKIILEEKMDETEEDDNEGDGLFLNEEDVKVICNALATYKPRKDEEHVHSILLEQFEEILAVDYNESPDVN
jgi:hypothetical protein